MLKELNPIRITNMIRQKYSTSVPLFLLPYSNSIKLEMKPYIQPFERELAMRELRSLLNPQDRIVEEHGYCLVDTDISEDVLRQRLTFWQRVGRICLEPTVQKLYEFTQYGFSDAKEKQALHASRRLRYGPHNLHEYRGKFFPQLVRSLINISGIPDAALLLDPMCGSGTATCEALSSGRSAIGADLNPLSVLISKVKSAVVLEKPSFFFNTIDSHLKAFCFKKTSLLHIWSQEDIDYLIRWFDSKALDDLASILSVIQTVQNPLYRDYFKICLSNIIRSVSWQKDTDLRVRKEIKPYIASTAISRFKEESYVQLDRIYSYLCILKIQTSDSMFSIRQGNAIDITDVFPEYKGKVDILVTSPPYAMALPYLDTDRLSLVVLGLLPRKQHKEAEAMMVGTREISDRQRRDTWECYLARKSVLPGCVCKLIDFIAKHNHCDNVGFRRKNLPALLGKYYLDMLDAMRSARSMMLNEASGYYIVGNNSTTIDNQKLEIPTDEFLFEIGAVAGWKQIEMIPMELLTSRDIFKNNRGSVETILCFRS